MDNIISVIRGDVTSVADIIVMSIFTLVAGGLFGLAFVLQSLSFNGFYVILLIVSTIFLMSLGIWTARETIRWQKRINIEINI